MEYLRHLNIAACLLFLVLAGCSKKEDSPVAPQAPAPVYFSMKNYYPIVDSTYYKMWNDGASEIYGGYTVRGGYRFEMIDYGRGDYSYYFGTDLMAGLGIDSTLVWYNPPIPHLPDSLAFNEPYNFTSSYVNGGFDVTLKYTHVLLDSATVVTPAGTFPRCAHVRQYLRLEHYPYYALDTVDNWYAKDVGLVKQAIPSGVSHSIRSASTRGLVWGGGGSNLPLASPVPPVRSQFRWFGNTLKKSYY